MINTNTIIHVWYDAKQTTYTWTVRDIAMAHLTSLMVHHPNSRVSVSNDGMTITIHCKDSPSNG